MKSYRLVVRQQGRIVGHFETSGLNALEDICVARAMFGITGGYQCELLVSDSEKRMLESGVFTTTADDHRVVDRRRRCGGSTHSHIHGDGVG